MNVPHSQEINQLEQLQRLVYADRCPVKRSRTLLASVPTVTRRSGGASLACNGKTYSSKGREDIEYLSVFRLRHVARTP